MIRKISFSLAFLLTAAFGFAMHAVAAPITPNLYELHGRGVQVTYSTTSLTGEPQLTYTTRAQTTTYHGKEVREERTELGLLVTVTTAFQVDVNFVTLSVLIPDINLQTGPERFSTVALITTHNTPFTLPSNIKGPVQTYQTLAMRGTASFVYFISGATGVGGTVSTNTCAIIPPPASCVYPFSDVPVEILDGSANIVAKTVADVDGNYKVEVPPGSYIVHVATNGVFPVCPDAKAIVPVSGHVIVDISCMALR
ncbi:MAG: hypothetical protein OEW08_11250 [Gammaproteobacteria bacterium]|nr:hypothetical protein [Gammaproteobacteria bacterium]